MMTRYERELSQKIADRYGRLSAKEFLSKLFEIGVVDYTRCKALIVREYVDETNKKGNKKIDAMWIAAEHFGCSYEYVRKCIYYYKDIHL